MAILTHLQSGNFFYLRAFHRFGRLAHSVDTLFEHPEITRIHAVIEWLEQQWYINDLSRNGVWVNGKQIIKNQNVPIYKGDTISFSQANELVYKVTNDDAPSDLLLPENNDNDAIILDKYHFLPDNKNPKLIIYFDQQEKIWSYESVEDHQQKIINDGQNLYDGEHTWQLFQAEMTMLENTLDLKPLTSTHLTFIFNLSLDEEQTELKVSTGDKTIEFDVRSHHYLTLLLARYKLHDINNRFAKDAQGWIQIKKLEKDLGLSEAHINIQIHRARKQFVELFNNEIYANELIERKRGKVRFGGEHFTIYKGHNCESTSIASKL